MPKVSRWRTKALLFALFLFSALLLIACQKTTSTPQSIFGGQGDHAREIQSLFVPIIWIAGAVFVLVEGLLVYALFRFRAKAGQAKPAQVHGNTKLELVWTIIPVLLLAGIAVPTLSKIHKFAQPAGPDALTIKVTAHQWWWEFDYPEEKIVTANELHIPVGRQVNVLLESADVIHSFWVPQLAGKEDVIPTHTNRRVFTALEAGTYLGQCAEFCGASHANMHFRVMAQTPEDYDAWLKAQQAPAPAPTTELATQGKELFSRSACIGCHTVESVPAARGKTVSYGSHIGSHTTIPAGTLDNTPESMAKWLKDPAAVKPNTGTKAGFAMPNLNLSDEQINVLVAFLESLK